MGPKEWLKYLLFHILFFKVLNVHTTSTWTTEVPQTISALQGSCVVVPCKFNYPDREIKPTDLTGIWHTTNQDIYIYHPDSSKVMEEFRGRTNLIGDLARKNCSLRINHLKKKDNGPFIFRIEIRDFNKYSYKDKLVSIDVQDSPAFPLLTVSGEVKAGDAVTASCSVSHSCPTELPHLIWSRSGTTTNQSEELPNGQWRVTSSLTFTATNSDHNQHLTCTAKYQQVTSVQSSKILNVAYAPVRVEVEPESTVVKEGDAVEVQCSSDSNPPAHGYQWYNITGTLLSEERIYKLHNVSRHTKALYCAAINTEGHKNSTPAKISVEYAPEIKEGPACSVRAAGVACLCVVDSEPPPEITWLLQRGSDASAGTERHGSITLGTLRSTQRLTELTCQASNSRGNTSAVFTPPQSGELQYISLIVAAVLLVAGMAVVVWLARRMRHNREQPVTGMDDAATTMTGTSYAMAARKEEKSINSGFYVNDEQMYGNIGVCIRVLSQMYITHYIMHY
ncbi:myelin-associated glycoprotein-like isoform X3 [Anguilla rostrata]